MATSGTYTFNPSIGDMALESFERCGIAPPAITRSHMRSFRRSVNFVLQEWANRGINLWAVDLQTIPLVANIATYVETAAAETINVLDVYYSLVNGGGPGQNIDRIMVPMSRTQYAETPNKLQPGVPTRYWYQKLEGAARQFTFWQTPQQGSPQAQINYYRMRRLQDANPVSGQTLDAPYRFLDTFCYDVAHRLAEKWKPERLEYLAIRKKESFELASDADIEDGVPRSFRVNLGGYWRP